MNNYLTEREIPEIEEQQEKSFDKWLDTFIEEKGIDIHNVVEVKTEKNTNLRRTKKDIGESVDMVLEGIKKAYRDYDGVKFVGFGTFTKKKTKTRIGTNPNTLEPIKIQSKG